MSFSRGGHLEFADIMKSQLVPTDFKALQTWENALSFSFYANKNARNGINCIWGAPQKHGFLFMVILQISQNCY